MGLGGGEDNNISGVLVVQLCQTKGSLVKGKFLIGLCVEFMCTESIGKVDKNYN